MSFLPFDPWNNREDLESGQFSFLNEPGQLGRPVRWEARGKSLLWRFHLHSFGYLHLLESDERARLCQEWIEQNPVGEGPGWHPYTISLRISNWCKLFGESSPASLDESLYEQAGYLSRNVEWYLSGNHLLTNAHALILAGLFFGKVGEAPTWLQKGLEIWRRELPRQVLPDGGHYERSPMYHIQVLTMCLDLLNVLPTHHDRRGLFQVTVRDMVGFLDGMLHPDGHVSLFNDCTFDGAPPPEGVEAYAEALCGRSPPSESDRPRRLQAFRDSGFYAYRDGPVVLIVDSGPLGPSHQPAHGHADIFSYELSVEGQRIVSDTGVFEYRAGEMRDYCRGTRAHNTVQVDGVDQAEVWGEFRVARRSEPTVEEARVREGAFHFRGAFSGYAKLIGDGLVHRRHMICDGKGGCLRVEDRVEGTGHHRVASRIHLHPEVTVERVPQGLTLSRDRSEMLLTASGPLDTREGWYCPRFGVRRRRTVVEIGVSGGLPARLSYEIRRL